MLRKQVEYQNEQCIMIDKDFKAHKEWVEADIEKAKQAKKKNKKVKKTLTLEVSAMDEECQSQSKRREEI